jgi:hypothetical protein
MNVIERLKYSNKSDKCNRTYGTSRRNLKTKIREETVEISVTMLMEANLGQETYTAYNQ